MGNPLTGGQNRIRQRGKAETTNNSDQLYRRDNLFEDRFGRPGKGNDKGKVENLVGFIRRNYLVPVPHVDSLEALNDDLAAQCRRRLDDRLRRHTETIGEAARA